MNSIPFSPFTEVAKQLDLWGEKGIPFVFLVDYLLEKAWAGSVKEAAELGIFLEFDSLGLQAQQVSFQKFPLTFESYASKFNQVQAGLKRGDSFLLNLTAETPIEIPFTLSEIYQKSDAPYKILVNNAFVSFSPETFVRIQGKEIASFPMKGTLEASEKTSASDLQNDPKEKAEHATIVDLIRNDLSKVAFPIRVEKYQYIDKVKTNTGELWQMSSKISGELKPELRGKYGSILLELLPAGSITGAPKKATMQIIKETEQYDRGFYTGIMGKFDGRMFNSGVMIRFIEKQSDKLVFKSGGGITVFSDVKKVYLPF